MKSSVGSRRGQALARTAVAAGLVLAATAAGGCKIRKASEPAMMGPSEFGTSLEIQANPDILTQDGVSLSRIEVIARGPNGEPIANLTLRAEIFANGVLADFGKLSARTVSTGSSGRAELTYTAPPPPAESVDTGTFVTILLTPIGNNHQNANARSVEIRLVPPGVILPPNIQPVASFTFSRPAEEGTPITFDASTSRDADGTIVQYSWNFGDGNTATGQLVSHEFSRGTTFTVTLTVTDDRGGVGTSSQQVVVGETDAPTASFSVSPTSPGIQEKVFFNASGSTAASGRRIRRYEWTFGDGGRASGVTVSHRYDTAGTFVVTLTVTDDAGKQGTATASLTVSGEAPGLFASFTFSPTDPVAGGSVNFNASDSTSPRPIVEYEWEFGDGTPIVTETDAITPHTFDSAGTFVVRLTITDSDGNTATTTQEVEVDP